VTATDEDRPDELRSHGWFGHTGRKGMSRRGYLIGQGLPADTVRGRPVIGIANSFSELNPCNGHLRSVAESVKRGVWEAGGLPLEFPTMSLGEPYMVPTTMLYRNLMSMDVEESIRANPLDGVVLLGGCDKTTPAQLMGAASVGLPTIMITGGPMLAGSMDGQRVGSGTTPRRLFEEFRAGRATQADLDRLESCLVQSAGHCMVMGTASTMGCLAEALGMQLPGSAAVPAVLAERYVLAQLTGRRIVEMVHENLTITDILTRAAFENAIRVNAAIGGSTNAVVHLLAIAGRAGAGIELADFDRLMRDIPLLVDLMPSGTHVMEDFYRAGGLPAVVRELGDLLDQDALTVTGASLGDNTAQARITDPAVVRTRAEPLGTGVGTAVLRGNLCPDGAVIKLSAASPELLRHRGRAVVFDSVEACERDIDDPSLAIEASDVLIVRNVGPRGYPGMPEVGNMPLPQRLLQAGVRDMVRITDARMSGTAFGTIALHVAPEAAVGGPLASVVTGDLIELDAGERRLEVLVDDEEWSRRRAAVRQRVAVTDRGWSRLYVDHVLQADRGVDLDFLVGGSGPEVAHLHAGTKGS